MTQEFVTLPREVVEQAQMWIPLLAEMAGMDPETTTAEFSEFADGRPASEFTIANVITALRAALEQPQGEQEPFTVLVRKRSWLANQWEAAPRGFPDYGRSWADERVNVYTHPQPKREPLTDEQVMQAVRHLYQSDFAAGMGFPDDLDVARAIEAAHNIK